jgi:transcriptional regulator GlxA family with amidase domain
MHVGIHVFDDAEALDVAGPYEVFTTAARVCARMQPGDAAPLLEVTTIARTAAVVRLRAGLRIVPDATFDTHAPLDVLVVPGGVVDVPLAQPDVIAWIAALSPQGRTRGGTAQRVRILASICTGAFLLARAGCLDGLEATTHWEDIDALRAMFPAVRVREGVRWVDQGPIVTSAGISAGIDASLHLVERLHSRELALRTARQMDVDWKEHA